MVSVLQADEQISLVVPLLRTEADRPRKSGPENSCLHEEYFKKQPICCFSESLRAHAQIALHFTHIQSHVTSAEPQIPRAPCGG